MAQPDAQGFDQHGVFSYNYQLGSGLRVHLILNLYGFKVFLQ